LALNFVVLKIWPSLYKISLCFFIISIDFL